MFAPVIPGNGLVGWRYLQRTYDAQIAAFSQSQQLTRSADYFEENIGKITSPKEKILSPPKAPSPPPEI